MLTLAEKRGVAW